MSKAIQAQVLRILADKGITFTVVSRGQVQRDGEKHMAYAFDVVLSRRAGAGGSRVEAVKVPYYMGPGHATKIGDFVKAPTPQVEDVLHALLLDGAASTQSFATWCGETGFEVDSIKALDAYLRCQDTGDGLARLFTPSTVDLLRDLLRDY